MPYDDAFYQAYTAYLNEPTVREAHDWIFSIPEINPYFDNVVDLGCGRSLEFWNYADPAFYTGIDQNGLADDHVWREDYRTFDYSKLCRPTWPVNPTAFVSLFSSEITAPFEENYDLYNRIFAECPSIQAGLVSGFFYEGYIAINPIPETGGIISFQTLEPIHVPKRDGYTERRITLHVPSKMFGPDVWEVWKLFYRTP